MVCKSLFPDDAGRGPKWDIFLHHTDIGQFYEAIPFDQLVPLIPVPNPNNKGPQGRMSVKGGLALCFLKSYLNLSDEKLLERLNTDWAIQYFCGITIQVGQEIKDKDFVGRWRRYTAKHLDIETFQQPLAQYWLPFIEAPSLMLQDAVCFESYIRYPTDVKLLWEAATWVYDHLYKFHKAKGLPQPRTNTKRQQKKQNRYAKSKRKTYKKRQKRRKSLLNYLNQGITLLQNFLDTHIPELVKDPAFKSYFKTIRKIYAQQDYMHQHKVNKVADRIVSLHKAYLRPIVRGKENKRVEFGAKVQCFQMDSITFIEHLSFEAFNEGTRLKKTVLKHQQYTGKPTAQLGGDAIYATNANRRFCTKRGIQTNFPPKGRPAKDEAQRKQMRSIIAKARATRMEGAFGNTKNHYGLQKIKARTQETETLSIAFGIWTANAVQIGKRMAKKRAEQSAKAA